MSAFRGALAVLASIVIAVAVVVVVTESPLATAANSTSVEGESMTVSPSSAGTTVRDSSATGGVALVLRFPGTATKTVSLPASATVIVRARQTRRCGSAPVMNVAVDGTAISTTPVSVTSWTNYTTAVTIPAGAHAIGVIFSNQGWQYYCQQNLLVDNVVVVASAPITTTTTTTSTTTKTTTTTPTTTTTTPATVTTTPTSNPAARLFNGDYSSGDFSQWSVVQTKYYNSSGRNYVPAYPATIVADAQKGNVGRFEVRSGDVPSFGGGERSEVESTAAQTGGTEGQTLWYQFSVRFDPTFPQKHADLGWGLTNQWHADANSSPPVGWNVDQRNGQWSLTIEKQSSPGVYIGTFSIFDVPLGTNWHDVKMQIHWSTSDTQGWIRLWHNGVRQKFLDGSDTYYVRTLIPGTTTVYYKEGYYRQAMSPTGIVYHAGFRSATDESGLN